MRAAGAGGGTESEFPLRQGPDASRRWTERSLRSLRVSRDRLRRSLPELFCADNRPRSSASALLILLPEQSCRAKSLSARCCAERSSFAANGIRLLAKRKSWSIRRARAHRSRMPRSCRASLSAAAPPPPPPPTAALHSPTAPIGRVAHALRGNAAAQPAPPPSCTTARRGSCGGRDPGISRVCAQSF